MAEKQIESHADNEVTLKELIVKIDLWIRFLLSKWIILVVALAIGCVLGFFYVKDKVTIYKATCTFVLESGSASSSQASSFASMVGIDLAGGSSGAFQGEGLLALYRSRLMIEKTLYTKIKVKDTIERLIDRFVRSTKMAKNWNAIAKKDQAAQMPIIVSDIAKNYFNIDSKALITVTVTSKDEVFSKEFADKLVDNVNSFYTETKTKKSQDAINILQKQSDSVRRVLNNSISGAASALDMNPNANIALQILRAPSQRKQVDVQAASTIYSEVMRNLEATKLALRKETPLIQIIDRPTYPVTATPPIKWKTIVIAGVFFMILAAAGLTLNLLYKKIIS